MNRIAFAFLWVSVFAMPWEDSIALPGQGSVTSVITIVAFALGILAIAAVGQLRSLRAFHVMAALFVAWAALCLFWTIDRSSTVDRVATYAQLALLTWLLWELAPTPGRQRALLQAYVLGAYVSALDTIANYLTSAVAVERNTAVGFNSNDLGFTLVLAIPMAWYLTTVQRSRLSVWVNRLYVPIGMMALLLTASRGAFVPGLIALLIIPLTLGRASLRTKAATCVLIIGSVYFANRFVPESSWTRLSTTRSALTEGTLTHRRDIWRAGGEVYARHPVLGVGPGTFAVAAGAYLDRPRPAHNAFLAVLVEQGPIGLTLFLGLFILAAASIPRMPPLERKVWAILVATLVIGLMPRNWDYRKPTWFVLGLVTTAAAAAGSARAPVLASAGRPYGRRWLRDGVADPSRPPVFEVSQ
jgi:O-antigen ligase